MVVRLSGRRFAGRVSRGSPTRTSLCCVSDSWRQRASGSASANAAAGSMRSTLKRARHSDAPRQRQYLAAMSRCDSSRMPCAACRRNRVFAQAMFAFELAASDPRIVGVNLVMPEDWFFSMRDYDLHMQHVPVPAQVVSRRERGFARWGTRSWARAAREARASRSAGHRSGRRAENRPRNRRHERPRSDRVLRIWPDGESPSKSA